MSPRFRTLVSVSALALGLLAGPAHADALTSLFDLTPAKVKAWRAAPQGALYWNQIDRVELSQRGGPPDNAPNQQPAEIGEAELAAALAKLQYRSARGEVLPLFSAEEIKRVQMALAAALGVANGTQDVLFVSTGPKKERGYTRTLTAAGRAFYADGALNVLVGEAGRDVMHEVRTEQGSQLTVNFNHGSRAEAEKTVALVAAPQAGVTLVRSDWLRVPLVAQAKSAATSAAPAAGAAAAVAQPAGASPAIKAQEERFELLKRLHDKGLISDAEYEKKREELLKSI